MESWWRVVPSVNVSDWLTQFWFRMGAKRWAGRILEIGGREVPIAAASLAL